MPASNPATASHCSPKNRNLEIRRVRLADIEDAPWNPREHSAFQQEALDSVVSDIGWFGHPDVFVTDDGKLRLCDGHLRKQYLLHKYGPDAEIDVNVTDFTEAEAKLATLTKDPIAALAHDNRAKQEQLLASLTESQQATVHKIIGKEQAASPAAGGVTFKEITPAPPMTFVLVGIPTMSFGKIAQTIEQLATVPEIEILENVSTGGT